MQAAVRPRKATPHPAGYLRISVLAEPDTASPFTQHYRLKLFLRHTAAGPEDYAGFLLARRLCLQQATARLYQPLTVYTAQNQEELYRCLYDGQHQLKTQITRQFAIRRDPSSQDLLLLDKLLLQPQFRGSGLGLWTMHHAIQRLSPPNGLVALKTFPLQYNGEATQIETEFGLAKLRVNFTTAVSRLRRYYGRLGFKRLGQTLYMAMPTAALQPLDRLGTCALQLSF